MKDHPARITASACAPQAGSQLSTQTTRPPFHVAPQPASREGGVRAGRQQGGTHIAMKGPMYFWYLRTMAWGCPDPTWSPHPRAPPAPGSAAAAVHPPPAPTLVHRPLALYLGEDRAQTPPHSSRSTSSTGLATPARRWRPRPAVLPLPLSPPPPLFGQTQSEWTGGPHDPDRRLQSRDRTRWRLIDHAHVASTLNSFTSAVQYQDAGAARQRPKT